MPGMGSTACLDLLDGIPPRAWVALSAGRWRVVATGGTYGKAVDGADAESISSDVPAGTRNLHPGLGSAQCLYRI